MDVDFRLARRLAMAGVMLLLAACSTTKTEQSGLQEPMSGSTNEPAAGFANMQPGSEEDFILNVGRRTFFTQGSASLDATAKATLDGQIAWLRKYPQWLVKVQGFADDPGGDSAQVSLSQKRADAVMAYLASGGIEPGRMWAKGYGRDRLVRDCTDTSCKVQNRRVVTNLRDERDS